MIGVLMSATLPARLGEPARAMIISRRIGRFRETFPVLLGTLVSQTALNIVALVLLGVVIVSSTDLFSRSSEHLFLVSLAPALLLIARGGAGSRPPLRLRADRPARREARDALVRVRSGLAIFRDPRRGPLATVAQLTAWAIQVAACFALAVAMGLDDAMGLAGAAAVLFAVNVTAVVPATPSNIGVFQLAVISVLTTGYGVGAADALAYGVILQAVEIATAVGLGLPALVREGMSWSDVRLRALSGPGAPAAAAARGERRRGHHRLSVNGPSTPSLSWDQPSRAAEGPGPDAAATGRALRAAHGATAGTMEGPPISDAFDLMSKPDRDILAAVRERVVVFDGGMGATLEHYDLSPEDYGGLPGKCHEALVLHRPDVIEGVHAEMLEAGAEVLETDSFQGSRLKLEEWGLGEHTVEINRGAAEIAREAAGADRFVAGSIGPTGFLPASDDPTLGDIGFASWDVFDEQAGGLVEGGADLIIIETAQDILEVKAAVLGAREAFKRVGRAVPIQVSVSLLPNGGKMLLGTDIEAVLAILAGLRGHHRTQLLDRARGHARCDPLPRRELAGAGPLHSQRRAARAGPRRRDDLPGDARAADRARRVRRTPRRRRGRRLLRHHAGAHRRARRAGGGHVPGERPEPGRPLVEHDDGVRPRPGAPADPGRGAGQLAGIEEGEGAAAGRRLRRPRSGRRGSGRRRRPRARRLRRPDRAPRRGRADGGDGEPDLADPARADPDRLHRARGDRGGAAADPRAGDRQLDQPGGRAGQARPDRAARERARRGADRADDRRGRHGEDRRAEARDRAADPRARLRRARARSGAADLRRAHLHADDRRRSGGRRPSRRSRGSAGSRRSCPASRPRSASPTSPSGSRSRLARSSTPSSSTTASRRASTWRWSTRTTSPPTARSARPSASSPTTWSSIAPKTRSSGSSSTSRARAPEEEVSAADATEGMEPEEALHFHILRRKKDGVEDWIDRSVEKIGAVPTLNGVLLPAMKEVGDKFGAGELILPFVLQSAEVMKRAVAQLEQYLDRIEGHTKGTVVIATVFGDVHDIGKSLVNTILTNNGYTVVDLGKQVPIEQIIDAAVEHDADAIGLSALLVSTSKQMPACIGELHERGHEFPVLIGGAAINRDFGRRALYPKGRESDEIYEPASSTARTPSPGSTRWTRSSTTTRAPGWSEDPRRGTGAAREAGGRRRLAADHRRLGLARPPPGRRRSPSRRPGASAT